MILRLQENLALVNFGFGYELGLKALRHEKMPSPLLAEHPANLPFYDTGRGLVWCLHELGKISMAREVLEQLITCDPGDPLGLKGWLDEIESGGMKMVNIDALWNKVDEV